jgi:hypothetical protein
MFSVGVANVLVNVRPKESPGKWTRLEYIKTSVLGDSVNQDFSSNVQHGDM